MTDERTAQNKRIAKGKKTVAAGHICINITPLFPEGSTGEARRILAPGQLVQMEEVNIHPGGTVANTGLAMKYLGMDACLMGKTGKDELGTLILNCLEKYGAAEDMILVDQEEASYSVVLAIPEIDRVLLHDPDVNMNFSDSDLDFEAIKEANLFHFGYPTLMQNIYRDQGEEMARVFRQIKEGGTTISLDMVAAGPASKAAGADWKGILGDISPYVDFSVPGAEELCLVLDGEHYRGWTRRANGKDVTKTIRVRDVKPLGQMALDMGVRVVLTKYSALDICYRTACKNGIEDMYRQLNLSTEAWKGREGFEPSFEPDTAVSATGVGDTNMAIFLASVLGKTDLEEVVEMVAVEGACCVAAYDVLSGLRSLEEARKGIRKGWSKREYRP